MSLGRRVVRRIRRVGMAPTFGRARRSGAGTSGVFDANPSGAPGRARDCGLPPNGLDEAGRWILGPELPRGLPGGARLGLLRNLPAWVRPQLVATIGPSPLRTGGTCRWRP